MKISYRNILGRLVGNCASPRGIASAKAPSLENRLFKLNEKITRGKSLERLGRFPIELTPWRRDTRILLERVFGEDSSQVADFMNISLQAYGVMSEDNLNSAYFRGISRAIAILTSIRDEIIEFGLDSFKHDTSTPLDKVQNLCERFHSVARQLRRRRTGRTTIDVKDEYDCQDLLFALLRIEFTDIRAEEWTPSYAGGSARMDFLLKLEEIVIEVKMTRDSMSERDLVDQLIVDRTRYEAHPSCKTLICFVYDPEGRISNSTAIITDFESTQNQLPVKILIYPKID